MKLSEAMRLGSMLKPQAFDQYVDLENTKTCAMGAAMDAAGLIGDMWTAYFGGSDHHVWRETWPWANVPLVAECPACDLPLRQKVGAVVAHLNNEHRWTRERIADWVQTLEDAQTTPVESREEVSTEEHAETTAASEAR